MERCETERYRNAEALFVIHVFFREAGRLGLNLYPLLGWIYGGGGGDQIKRAFLRILSNKQISVVRAYYALLGIITTENRPELIRSNLDSLPGRTNATKFLLTMYSYFLSTLF